MLSRALIIYLILTETMYYLDSKLIFKFKPDVDMDTKLKIHIDVTVATPCSSKFIHFSLMQQEKPYSAFAINTYLLICDIIDRYRCRHIGFDQSKCVLVRHSGRAGYVVGIVSKSTSLLRVHATFERLFARRVPFIIGI